MFLHKTMDYIQGRISWRLCKSFIDLNNVHNTFRGILLSKIKFKSQIFATNREVSYVGCY